MSSKVARAAQTQPNRWPTLRTNCVAVKLDIRINHTSAQNLWSHTEVLKSTMWQWHCDNAESKYDRSKGLAARLSAHEFELRRDTHLLPPEMPEVRESSSGYWNETKVILQEQMQSTVLY